MVEDHEGRITTAEGGLTGEVSARQSADTLLNSRLDGIENIAFTSANVYPDVATGRAVVADG